MRGLARRLRGWTRARLASPATDTSTLREALLARYADEPFVTVLPPGIKTSDDPFPAARSAVYRVSYDRRTAEAKDYPRTETGAKP